MVLISRCCDRPFHLLGWRPRCQRHLTAVYEQPILAESPSFSSTRLRQRSGHTGRADFTGFTSRPASSPVGLGSGGWKGTFLRNEKRPLRHRESRGLPSPAVERGKRGGRSHSGKRLGFFLAKKTPGPVAATTGKRPPASRPQCGSTLTFTSCAPRRASAEYLGE